ncbi:hypothetical protein [Methanobacterium spitsbergense]|uniref:Uncharacterized protein n=1 Tax=Methanobacterium spitsbergense TaxID=2874285 RepID=A0A8T5UXI1_9EURY|nr:hypothetical protein [Methanobacterium spitsbergense]MBZ2167007.1 hypothetical protein [Methanobacterium spitsbergense]
MSYADSSVVETLTNRLKPDKNTDKYEALLSVAIDDAEDIINGELIKNNIPIPTILESIDPKDPLNTLIKAGNLYTASFMFNAYYSDNESLSPTSKAYKESADDKVKSYIDIILGGYDEDTKEQGKPDLPPVGSLVNRY